MQLAVSGRLLYVRTIVWLYTQRELNSIREDFILKPNHNHWKYTIRDEVFN